MKSKRNSTAYLRLLYGAITGLLIGISALAIYLVQDRLRAPKADDIADFSVEGEVRFDGAIRIEPPIVVPDFTLIKQDGRKTSLRDLRGQFVLLTFGFTNCPDICPLTLSDLQRIKELLGKSAERLAFVFISVDGSRDTPAALHDYFAFRELDGIIGLTGAEDYVRELGAPFGLSFEVSGEAAAAAYSVNHTAGSFLLDPRGRWIMRFQFGLPPDRVATELSELLR